MSIKGFTETFDINNYLTIEALEDGLSASLSTRACEYCVDGDGNWKSLAKNTETESINSGHTLSFRGNLTPSGSNGIGTFTISKKCNLKGNCMSMLFGDNAADNYSLNGKNHAFDGLFYDCANVVNVSSNFLPATTLADSCYSYMFGNCSNLTTAPKLPASALASSCYLSMFLGCKNLTTAPELPATTLASSCYYSMFYGCTNLTVAPELPATTLASSCYYSMFYGCTNLTVAPELPATTLASSCYYSMFYKCTSLTTAPELPATTLANYCYYYMFYGCSKLNYIKMLATNISASRCLYDWVYGVASRGTFVKNKNATWNVTGANGVPSGWTVVNDGEESGGKIVNHLRKGKTSVTKQVLTLDFPAETSLNVYYTTSLSGSTRTIFQKGNSTFSIGLGPGESVVSIDRLDPNEDDVYIYKIDYE